MFLATVATLRRCSLWDEENLALNQKLHPTKPQIGGASCQESLKTLSKYPVATRLALLEAEIRRVVRDVNHSLLQNMPKRFKHAFYSTILCVQVL